MNLIRAEKIESKFEQVTSKVPQDYMVSKIKSLLIEGITKEIEQKQLYSYSVEQLRSDAHTKYSAGIYTMTIFEGEQLLSLVKELTLLNPDVNSENGVVIKKIVELLK